LLGFFFFKKNQVVITTTYVLTAAIVLNLASNNTYISLYYQIISLLNTKDNFIIIYIVYTLILLNIFFSKNRRKWVYFTLLWLLVVHNVFISTNLHFFTGLDYFNNNLNSNLINGIVLIHPIFLYIFYGLFFIKIHLLLKKNLIFSEKNHKQHNNATSTTTNFYPTLLILISLILGCWWAEQELSWGGWWSWDFVELIALNFLIVYFLKIHVFGKNQNSSPNPTFFLNVVVVSIMVVRFNIINSIHNFVNLDSQNQYMYYIVLVVILLNFVILFGSYISLKSTTRRVAIAGFFFYLLFLLFFLFFLVNMFSGTFIFYNFSKNIQYIYLYVFILVLLNNTLFSKAYKPLIFFIITCFTFYTNIAAVDYIIMLVAALYVIFSKSASKFLGTRSSFVLTIHLCVMLLLPVVLYQIFIFKEVPLYSSSLSQIVNLKLSTFLKILSTTTTHNFIENNNYQILFTKNNIDIFSNTLGGETSPVVGFFKNVFEKTTTASFFFLDELYSYNLQTLVQTNTSVFVLLLILTITLVVIVVSKGMSRSFFF
jgi:cytochrome c biogenesis factor